MATYEIMVEIIDPKAFRVITFEVEESYRGIVDISEHERPYSDQALRSACIRIIRELPSYVQDPAFNEDIPMRRVKLIETKLFKAVKYAFGEYVNGL